MIQDQKEQEIMEDCPTEWAGCEFYIVKKPQTPN